MKCVLALAVLLHLGCMVKSNIKLNEEIMKGLDNLNWLCRSKKVTPPDMIRVPSKEMNASSCVGAFVRELRDLLNNVTVHEDSTYVLVELQANLEALGQDQENNQDCRMIQKKRSLTPFKPYVTFLRTLNNLRRR